MVAQSKRVTITAFARVLGSPGVQMCVVNHDVLQVWEMLVDTSSVQPDLSIISHAPLPGNVRAYNHIIM